MSPTQTYAQGKRICTSKTDYVREKDLYEKLLPILGKLAWDREEIELLYLASKEDITRESEYLHGNLANLKQEESALIERKNKLLDLFLDSSIPKISYEEKSTLLENQLLILQKQISETKYKIDTAVSTLEPTKKLFLDCVIWANDFLTLLPDKKQNIVHEVLWNLSMKDKNIIDYQLKSPYLAIANLPQNADFHARLGDLESNQDSRLQRPLSYR